MTEIEAHETLEDLQRILTQYRHISKELTEANGIAIKALEKQIPKKIIHQGCYDNEGVWHTWNGIDGVPYDLCPSCKTNLCTDGVFGRDKKRMNYCENCGQKLDWGSDEE